jgi:hypothetical protein
MTTTFSEKAPKLRLSEDLRTQSARDRQQGCMLMFQGAMIGVRNPRAHTHGHPDDPRNALELLALCNHLIRTTRETTKTRSGGRGRTGRGPVAPDPPVAEPQALESPDKPEWTPRAIEGALAQLNAMMNLARRAYQRDLRTFNVLGKDESVLPDLQNARAAFAAYAQMLPLDRLPKVRIVAEFGVRSVEDADRLRGACLEAIEELGRSAASIPK